jgi:hypothetical protein
VAAAVGVGRRGAGGGGGAEDVGGAWDAPVWRAAAALFLGALRLGSAAAVAVGAPRLVPALLTRGAGGTTAAPALFRGGTKRARVAADPAAAAALGFGAVGGSIAPAPATSVGGTE